eukprot:SAG11_NODE_4059_length_2084_cov_1.146599_3_plen_70_part_00
MRSPLSALSVVGTTSWHHRNLSSAANSSAELDTILKGQIAALEDQQAAAFERKDFAAREDNLIGDYLRT